jgi:RNA polymerase primary sigma factor
MHLTCAGRNVRGAPEAVNPHTAAEAAALGDCVAEVLAELTPREERILRMLFGIRMPDHTLEAERPGQGTQAANLRRKLIKHKSKAAPKEPIRPH